MKARVKATGEILEFESYDTDKFGNLKYFTKDFDVYDGNEVEIILERDPDYWTRLEHQYAGMAMQQLVHLVNVGYEYVYEETAIIALNFAHALVEQLKEKEERK